MELDITLGPICWRGEFSTSQVRKPTSQIATKTIHITLPSSSMCMGCLTHIWHHLASKSSTFKTPHVYSISRWMLSSCQSCYNNIETNSRFEQSWPVLSWIIYNIYKIIWAIGHRSSVVLSHLSHTHLLTMPISDAPLAADFLQVILSNTKSNPLPNTA